VNCIRVDNHTIHLLKHSQSLCNARINSINAKLDGEVCNSSTPRLDESQQPMQSFFSNNATTIATQIYLNIVHHNNCPSQCNVTTNTVVIKHSLYQLLLENAKRANHALDEPLLSTTDIVKEQNN